MDNQESKHSKISEWEKMHKNPFKEEKPAPIKQDEVFDPEQELEKIKKLPKSERRAALSVYKDKLDFQLHGYARLRDELIREMKANNAFTVTELRAIAYRYVAIYGINNPCRNIIESCIDDACKRHYEIVQMRNDVPDDRLLCKEIFNFEPEGKVTISAGVLTLDVNFENTNDFALAYSEGEVLTDDKRKEIATNISGFFIKTSGTAARFNGKIIALNGVGKDDPVYIHEEQHAFHDILSSFTEYPTNRSELLKLSESSCKLNPGEQVNDIEKAYLEKFYRTHRANALIRVKDEILAYKKQNTATDETIYNYLAADKSEGGAYDYTDRMKVKMINYYRDPNNSTEPARELVLNMMTRIMYDEYYIIIKDAINSFNHLIEAGYSIDQAVDILSVVPLDEWSGTVRRVASNVGYKNKIKLYDALAIDELKKQPIIDNIRSILKEYYDE